jgi:hypothetical protein
LPAVGPDGVEFEVCGGRREVLEMWFLEIGLPVFLFAWTVLQDSLWSAGNGAICTYQWASRAAGLVDGTRC